MSFMNDTQHFDLAGQPQMFAKVVLASRHPVTKRVVYTLHLRYPRIVHAEMMTHRVFCRNARSSRAVPVKTMLDEVQNIPFVPWHWGKNQKGMQAAEECNELINVTPMMKSAVYDGYELPYDLTREQAWLHARNHAAATAGAFMKAGYHKQVANRLLEPFSWIDFLVTATDWKNFLHLRDHGDAEPHIRDLAKLVNQALQNAKVQDLSVDEWHLPYITADDWAEVLGHTKVVLAQFDMLKKVSAARCARISYAPFDGNPSYERELERFELLIGNEAVHASPLEHQCRPDEIVTIESSYWRDSDNFMLKDVSIQGGLNPELHGPLRDFVQFRKTVPNEAVHE